MNTLLWIFVGLLVAKLVMEWSLSVLNHREVIKHKDEVPRQFAGFMDLERYKKSVAYTLERERVGRIEMIYEALVLAAIVFSGVLPWMYNLLSEFMGSGLWEQSLVMVSMLLLLAIPSLPFDWWNQFRIEEKFGFNRSSLGLWVTDKVKGAVLAIVFGVPVVWVILRFFEAFPETWWIWGFGFFMVFQLLMLVLYPRLILPIFNKLQPLEEGELKDTLMSLADKLGFKAKTIEVMDGSKRSGHSNAFFTGFGKFRHIVLFDTLMEQLEPRELEAVLAHEIGHYKKGHVPKMLAISSVSTFVSFGFLGWIIQKPWFFESFGFEFGAGVVPALILLSVLVELVTFWITPFFNRWSRNNEYEADSFAKKAMNSPMPLISSLQKLSEKNLSNLTPNHWYSRFYYSHPTLLERETALLKNE